MDSGFRMQKSRTEIARIVVPEGRRPLDEENVLAIMASMKLIGLRQPINLIANAQGADVDFGQMKLVTGGHRLEAARRLGWKEIDSCTFIGDDKRSAELAEIVENLHRKDLSATERMAATARLKVIEAEMEAERAAAEAKAAGAINSANAEKIAPAKRKHRKVEGAKRGRKVGTTKADSNVSLSKQLGIDETTVRRDNKRNEALAANKGIVDRMAKLPAFDKQSAVDALIAMPVEKREEVVAAIERGEKVALANKPATPSALDQIKRLLPRLTASERNELAAMLGAASAPSSPIIAVASTDRT